MDISRKILSDIIVYMKYARYMPLLKRRETWKEIVDRNKNMHIKKYPKLKKEIEEVYKYVYDKKVLPSMRGLQFGGKAIEKNPARQYNCSALAISTPEVFREFAFLLMSGCGVGYSVQKHHVAKLPPITIPKKKRRCLVADSIEGWADAIGNLIESYFGYKKSLPVFDFSDIREKGKPLKTSGGLAPGPEPLKDCLHNIKKIFDRKKDGEKLTTLEVHDICCYIADCVVVGGTRRSSCISLFSFDDTSMLECKFGRWYEDNPQRARANNSAVILRDRIKEEEFYDYFEKIRASGNGEPGIFFSNSPEIITNPCQPGWAKVLTKDGIKNIDDINVGDEIWSKEGWTRVVNKIYRGIKSVFVYETSNGIFYGTKEHKIVSNGKKIEVQYADSIDVFFPYETETRNSKILFTEKLGDYKVYDLTVDNNSHTYWSQGCDVSNCGEISIGIDESCGTGQMCNLVEINASDIDSQEELNKRAKAAAFIATLQAGYTDFHYLRDSWKEKTDEDALIGVGLTGIASGNVLKFKLREAAKIVLDENERVANLIGINKAKRTTCVKPSGTASLVLGCSSGIHSWHSSYYIRRIRVGKSEPIYDYLKKNHSNLIEDDFFKPTTEAIISVPVKAPDNAITRRETALQFLERVKRVYNGWIKSGHREGLNTNNISCTVTIKENEWERVKKWLWENKEHYTAITVIPYDNRKYVQAPFEEITKEEYEKMLKNLKEVKLVRIKENEDNTKLAEVVACSGGACEIV